MDGLTSILLICTAGLSLAWLLAVQQRLVAGVARRFVSLPRLQQVALVLAIGVMTVCAQKSGTNDVAGAAGDISNAEVGEAQSRGEEDLTAQRGSGLLTASTEEVDIRSRSDGTSLSPSSVTSATSNASVLRTKTALTANDIARGYALVEVRTNETVSYERPTNGVEAGTWGKTGAYQDVVRVSLSADCTDYHGFLWGEQVVTSLWAYTWGKGRPRIRDRVHEIVAVGTPMSCVPGEGRLWTAATTNGSWLITWENFREGRLAKNISAQIELFANGDFITRSNEVECVYRRVNPDDWDGDGLANEIDGDPLVAADAPQFGPNQTLPDGANESAYCWVDLVVPQADAKVTFSSSQSSNLADPSFIAKAGETNRVTLLIGKAYHATCAFPFEIVGTSCVLIETHLGENNRTADICWPVRISATGDAAFSMTVDPVCLGGGFTWTNSCCSVLGSGTSFSYSCRGRCSCTGCSASGYYGYEGFRIGCRGGSCGCSSSGDYCPETTTLDDAPYAAGISLSFSKRAVIFEDRYERAPGVWVEKNSTATYLTGVVHGGPNGGTATFDFEGRDKLDGDAVPASVVVPAGQRYDFKIKYAGQAPSGAADDVVVRGTFTESGGEGEPIESEATLTSVRVDITAVEMTRTPMPEHRRTFGVREIVSCRHEPSSADFSFSMNASDAVTDLTEGRVYCPWTGGTYVLRMTVRNAAYFQALRVVEPRVVCREAVWNGVVGTVGCAGQVGMNLSLYVEPSTVSFSGVYMVEVADDEVGVRTGYFADGEAEKVGELSHTEAAGAGVWIQVHGDEWAMDAAGRATIYPTPWCEGRKEWRIPVGWGDYLHQLKGSVRPDPTTQVFTLKEDGTASVSKYGHVIERRTDNKVYLDGVLQD